MPRFGHKSSRRRKAFTAVDMLISCLCMGLLTVAIVTFAASVNGYQNRIKVRERMILEEYQDVLLLETYGYTGYAKGDCELHKANQLLATTDIKAGETKQISTLSLVTSGYNQTVLWESENTGICDVSPTGLVTAKKDGVTVVRAVVVNRDSEGNTDETDSVQYFPIRVGNGYSDEKMFAYIGRYYRYWITSANDGAQKFIVQGDNNR